MDLKAYHYVRTQLDFSKRRSTVLTQLVVDGSMVTLCVYLLGGGEWVSYALSQCLGAMIFFRQFSLMHEAVHGTVSDNKAINNLTGVLAGVFCFMPFESWRRLHLEHHAWAGNVERDPSNKLRKDYDPSHKMKYAILSGIWKSWIPVMGLLQQFVFWLYPIQQLKNPEIRPRIKMMIALSLVVPWFCYGFAMYLFPQTCNLANFVPAFTLYLMMVELINFPHHMDVYAYRGTHRIPVLEQYRVTRSSTYPSWFARFFLLNFNLHVEHHLFPNLPWHQLEKAQSLLKPQLGAKYNESKGNAWIKKNRKLDLEKFLPLAEPAETKRKKAA